MNKMLFRSAALIAAAVVAVAPTSALACYCDDPGSPARQLREADVVFVGRAGFSRKVGPDLASTTFTVVEAFKPRSLHARTQVSVSHFTRSPMCGVSFIPLKKYILITYREEGGGLGTSSCSRPTHSVDAYRQASQNRAR